jgi:hypothetical protein
MIAKKNLIVLKQKTENRIFFTTLLINTLQIFIDAKICTL